MRWPRNKSPTALECSHPLQQPSLPLSGCIRTHDTHRPSDPYTMQNLTMQNLTTEHGAYLISYSKSRCPSLSSMCRTT
jgi:hypothetical protein